MGVTESNGDVNTFTPPSHFKMYNFSKNDIIVVCGRTRDISRNETNKGLRCSKQFAMQASNSNIILDVPHRHDLEENYCVNKEVTVLSRKLHKIMKPFQHVQLLKKCLHKTWFTYEFL
jgi:hypothetical protein